VVKILTIFGTRPEAIKLSPVIKEFIKHRSIRVVNCNTAQHREMIDQVLNLFDIGVHYDLNLMKEDQNLLDFSSKLILKLKRIFEKEKPDLCLVQGDTASAFIAGLVAFYLRVKIGHVEAGLRTRNKYSPFPEEANRHLLSVIVDFHFAPTKNARKNLLEEGISPQKIYVTGNTVVDSLLYMVKKCYKSKIPDLKKVDFKKKIILVTAHRRESFGKPFEDICLALKEIVSINPDVEIVYPVHLNPNVQVPVKRILNKTERIHLIAPLDYRNFVLLLKNCYIVLTDSGGIQEEAPSLGKPVLVMREVTERPEAVRAGTAMVVGVNKKNIVRKVNFLLHSQHLYKRMAKAKNPFGDGKAAKRIVKIVLEQFKK